MGDEDGLTHLGQSLGDLDDLSDTGLRLNDEEEEEEDEQGTMGRATVRSLHFGGFSDDEDGDDDATQGRKKSKAEVMKEVIAKSKAHKYERQKIREENEGIAEALDGDFDDLHKILFADTKPFAHQVRTGARLPRTHGATNINTHEHAHTHVH